jgi:hypothetical protein
MSIKLLSPFRKPQSPLMQIENAMMKLPPQQRAQRVALMRDQFVSAQRGVSALRPQGLEQGALVDRSGARFLPGERQTFVNRAGDKNVAARAGAPAAWHGDVSTAIQRVLSQGLHPIAEGSASIEEGDKYHAAVAQELRNLGYEAFFDGEELQVKKPGADHSESYDISTWKGEVRDFYASFSRPPAF